MRDKEAGNSHEFVLGANCKTERVGVDQGVWTDPNGDFVPIFSRDEFLILKAFDRADKGVMRSPPSLGVQPERQLGTIAAAFDRIKTDLRLVEGQVLSDAEKVVMATLNNRPLVAMTRMESERYQVELEYPVKTMNANERDMIYQTDTGPVLMPDCSKAPERLMAGFEMAFAAFNGPHWTEFIVRDRVQVGSGIEVYHYCRPVRWEAVNQVLQLA